MDACPLGAMAVLWGGAGWVVQGCSRGGDRDPHVRQERGWQGELVRARFALILAIELCFQMGSFVVNPIVSSYAVAIGGAVVVGGFLAGLNSVSALAARPFVGMRVDRVALPKLLLMAGVLSFLSALLSAVVQNVFLLAACRVVFGLSFAFKSTVVVALARLSLPKQQVGVGLSYVSLLYVLANAVGPLVGTELGARWGYPACFLLSAALFCMAVALTLGLVQKGALGACGSDGAEKAPAPASGGGFPRLHEAFSFRDFVYRPAIKPTIMAGMVSFTLGSTSTLLVLALADRNMGNVSVFFLVSALAMVVSRPFAGKLSDRHGFLPAFVPAVVSAALAMVVLAFAESLAALVAAAVLFACGQCTLTVLIQSDGMRDVPKDQAGRASNTLFLGPDVGMFLGPAVGGAVLQVAGPSALFLGNAAVIVFMAAFYFLARWQYA